MKNINEMLSKKAKAAVECTLVMNTRWGYCMRPAKCNSIRQALQIAEESGMAYRIFDKTGKQIRSGRRVKK